MARTSIFFALTATILTLAVATAGSAWFLWYVLPKEGQVAGGTRIAGGTVPVDESPEHYIRKRSEQLLGRTVTLGLNEQKETTTLGALGVRADEETTLRRAMAVGRQGSWWYRLHESWIARGGRINVPLSWEMDATPVLERVELWKEDRDEPGIPARYDFETKSIKPHQNGRYLDAYSTIDQVDRLVRAGGDLVKVSVLEVPPLVTASFLERLDISQRVGHYETRFAYTGGQANRAHNIATAASKLDGVVMLPGEVVSFNQIVGYRTLENGFRTGWEIFRGEMVEGVGGGTCQVASTLYAAAFLGGLDVIDRSPHSRPIGYMPVGLDATVVDGLVDLKLRNPFPFPVVLHTRVEKGVIVFEILGEQQPVRVTFRGDVTGTQHYKRQIREASWLQEGRVIRKQRGIRGYTVRRVRLIRDRDGRQREEVSRDVYPPTTEIYVVPPGTDPDRDLPPLSYEAERNPDGIGESENESEDECEGECEAVQHVKIENAPAARAEPPKPQHRVVIDR